MNALILVPTYNERENLPILVGGVLARHAGPRAGRRLARWHRPDRRRARATVSGAPRRHASHRSTRAGTVLSRRVSHRDRERRRCRVPDGRRPVTRSEVPAVADRGTADADLVIGSRYIPGGGVENWPLHRVMLSGFANTYIRTVTGLRIHDCTGGFRCWRREALARIRSTASPPTAIRSSSKSPFTRPRPACASPNGRSCSSNAGWARRNCRAAC